MRKKILIAKALSAGSFIFVLLLPFANLTPSVVDALTLTDVITKARLSNGNIVSDADETPEVPNTAKVLGAGNVSVTWDRVTLDQDGNSVTPESYNFNYKLSSAGNYTTVGIPNQYNGYALNLSSGTYDYYIDVVINGCPSGYTVYQFTVP